MILGFMPVGEIYISLVYVTKKYGVEGFTVGGGIECHVWVEREIRDKNFKYMNGTICRNSLQEDPSDGETCYWSRFVNKDKKIKIGFHG